MFSYGSTENINLQYIFMCWGDAPLRITLYYGVSKIPLMNMWKSSIR